MDDPKETSHAQEDPSKFPVLPLDFGAIESQYANSTLTQASNWDVRFLFSEQISDSKVIAKASIVMGHQQAKAFHLALGNTLERLESAMGGPVQFEPKNPLR
jgi:hypothetical protein